MHTTGVKLLHHPVVGDLDLPFEGPGAVGGALGGFIAAIDYHLLFWVDGSTNILAAIMVPAGRVGILALYVGSHFIEEEAHAIRSFE